MNKIQIATVCNAMLYSSSFYGKCRRNLLWLILVDCCQTTSISSTLPTDNHYFFNVSRASTASSSAICIHLATYSDVINCIEPKRCSISTKSATRFFNSSVIMMCKNKRLLVVSCFVNFLSLKEACTEFTHISHDICKPLHRG